MGGHGIGSMNECMHKLELFAWVNKQYMGIMLRMCWNMDWIKFVDLDLV